MRRLMVAVALASFACTAAGGCGRGAGAREDGDAGSDVAGDAPPTFAVSGYVVGLRGGEVTLENGAARLTVGVDGAFTFPGRLPDGAAYAVTVGTNPTGQLCTIAGAAGVVAGADVVDVAVTCLSADATLESLSIAPGALVPAFAPDVTDYGTAAAFTSYQQTVTVRAVPHDPGAVVRVAGADGQPGVPVEVPLAPGPQTIAVTVTAPSGATRTYLIATSRTPAVLIKASNAGMYDGFGRSMAISGDTLVVGASGESSGAAGVDADQTNDDVQGAGAVYVFRQSGGTWTQEAYIKASNPGRNDFFGATLAIDGDTLVVGAEGEASGACGADAQRADAQSNDDLPDAGAVYVFERHAGTWAQTAYLKASSCDSEDLFGGSVAVKGDTLVVGAFGESSAGGDPGDNSAPGAGAAYVFERRAGLWTETAYLKASNPDANDGFGGRVAVDGDTIVVGAIHEASSARGVGGDGSNNDAPYAGAAYVFGRARDAWTEVAYLKASNARGYMSFGNAVAISGDTIIVGAYAERSTSTGVDGDQYARDSNLADLGSAYVFVRQGATVVQQAYLKAFGTCYEFGLGLAIEGDTALVGSLCGMGYSYVRAAGAWSTGTLFNFRAQKISLGPTVALAGGRFVFFTNDNSAATGIDPPPTTAVASLSGGVYVLE